MKTKRDIFSILSKHSMDIQSVNLSSDVIIQNIPDVALLNIMESTIHLFKAVNLTNVYIHFIQTIFRNSINT